MNGSAAGWHPDPTGRHQYRYWDGSQWTDDVADAGVGAVDPVGGGPSAGTPAWENPTQPVDPGSEQSQPLAPPGSEPTDEMRPIDPLGSEPTQQLGASDTTQQFPPVPPPAYQPGKRRPTGLILGIAALVVALIGGGAYVLAADNDDSPDTETTAETSGGPADDEASGDSGDDNSDDTSTDDGSGDDDSGDDGDSSGDESSDDAGSGDDDSESALVDAMAAAIEERAGGALTGEQAECVAQAIVDELGLERVIELGLDQAAADPFSALSNEDQVAIVSKVLDCVPADVLADVGPDNSSG